MTFDLYADRTVLLSALNSARPFVSTSKDGPGRFALVSVTGQTVTISANSGEAFGVVRLEASARRGGEAYVNLGALLDDVKSIRDAVIHLEVIKNGAALRVTGTTDTRTTPLFDDIGAASLPVPPVGNADGWTCAGSALSRALHAVIFAIASEDVRWGLNGAHVEVDDDNRDEIRIVATDGHRLALARVAFRGLFAFPPRALISRVACKGLAGLDAGELQISIAEGWLHVALGADRFGWRLIDGEFPDYRAVIPKETQSIIRCRRADLLAKVKAVKSVTDRSGKDPAMRFTAHDGELTLKTSDDGREAVSTLPCETERGIHCGFNASYLADALDALDCDGVRIRLNHPLAPAIVEPDDAGGSFGVVMPMRID